MTAAVNGKALRVNQTQSRRVELADQRAFGWFKAMRSPDALELIRANPLAFVLAYMIARRANWTTGFNAKGLALGEAFLGDYKECGMSEQNYRTAKAQLEKFGFATFKPTNKGTVARLVDSRLFSFLPSLGNGQINGQVTDAQRLTKIRRTTKERSRVLPLSERAEGESTEPAIKRDATGRPIW